MFVVQTSKQRLGPLECFEATIVRDVAFIRMAAFIAQNPDCFPGRDCRIRQQAAMMQLLYRPQEIRISGKVLPLSAVQKASRHRAFRHGAVSKAMGPKKPGHQLRVVHIAGLHAGR